MKKRAKNKKEEEGTLKNKKERGERDIVEGGGERERGEWGK